MDDIQFPDQNTAFAAQAEALKRRRALAQQLIQQGMQGNTGSGYQGGKVFIVGNPLANIASSVAGNIFANQNDQQAAQLEQQQRQQEQSLLADIANAPDPQQRQAAMLRAAQQAPSLRDAIKMQVGWDEQEAARQFKQQEAEATRLEKSEQEAENRVLKAEEGELNRQNRLDLRQTPTVVVHSGGGSKAAGDGSTLGGPITQMGVDMDGNPVYRHTKSGQLFQIDEKGQQKAYTSLVAPKPDAATKKAVVEAGIGIGNIDDALTKLDAKGAEGATGPLNALPGAEVARQFTGTPEQIAARAAVSNIGSLKLHDRSGAAVTVSEFPRLAPFIPKVTDTAPAAKIKLNNLRREYELMQNEWRTGSNTDRLGGKSKPGQSSPSRLKFNPQTGRVE